MARMGGLAFRPCLHHTRLLRQCLPTCLSSSSSSPSSSSSSSSSPSSYSATSILSITKESPNLFSEAAVARLSRQDGVPEGYRMVYRETRFGDVKYLQKIVMYEGSVLALYWLASHLCRALWPPELPCLPLVAPLLLATYLSASFLLHYIQYYRVPLRLYHSPSSDTYLLVVNRALPGARPSLAQFGPQDIVKDRLRLPLLPFTSLDLKAASISRKLWMSPGGFTNSHHYWRLGGLKDQTGGLGLLPGKAAPQTIRMMKATKKP